MGWLTRILPAGGTVYGRRRTELIIAAVIAVIFSFTGGLVQSLNFLLWVGISLLIIAVFAFVIRSLSGQRA